MKYLSALLCLSVVVIVAAEIGEYTPRAYYRIDEEGNQSPLVFIDSLPEFFHRARRQVNPYFPAFPNNFPFSPLPPNPQFGPVLNNRFGETNAGGNLPVGNVFPFAPIGFPQINIPQIRPGQPGTTFTGSSITSTVQSSPSGGLASRFGEENKGPVTTGQTVTTTVDKDGKVTQTTTHLRPDGSSYTTQSKG